MYKYVTIIIFVLIALTRNTRHLFIREQKRSLMNVIYLSVFFSHMLFRRFSIHIIKWC